MLCYVMLCYVMLCYVMLCYVMLWYGMAWLQWAIPIQKISAQPQIWGNFSILKFSGFPRATDQLSKKPGFPIQIYQGEKWISEPFYIGSRIRIGFKFFGSLMHAHDRQNDSGGTSVKIGGAKGWQEKNFKKKGENARAFFFFFFFSFLC